MNNKDEDYIIEESTENNKEKKANNSVVIMSICFGLFLFGLISLLFLSPKKSTPTADIEHKVERAKPVNTFIALKIPPKIPVFKTGERFKFSISREIYFSGNMKEVTLQIKVPENVANRQKIYNLEIMPKEQKFVDKSDGKYAHIFIPNPQGKITVTIKGEASVRTYTLEIAEKIKKNIDGFLNQEDKQYYLKETGGLEVNSRLLQLTARDEIQTATNDIDTVKNIFDYVVEQMRYDTNEINKDKGALKALQSRRGVCEEFTDLFVTFCRIKGIPARVQAGFDLPFKDDMKDE